MKKGLATIWIVVITFVIMAGLGAGGYYFLNSKQLKERNDLKKQISDLTNELNDLKTENTVNSDSDSASTGSSSSANTLSTYTSTKYGYSLKYPKTFSLVDWMWNVSSKSRVPQDGKVVWIDKEAISEKAIVMDADPQASYFSLWVSDEVCKANSFGTEGVVVTETIVAGVSGWKAIVTDNTNIMGGNYTTTYAANRGTMCYYLQIVNADAKGTHDVEADSIVTSFTFTK